MPTGTTPTALPAGGSRYGAGTAVAVPGGAGAVARAGSVTHGGWTANVASVLEALGRVRLFQDGMVANLTAADASESQINDVGGWSDQVTIAARLISEGLGATEATVGRYVDAVEAAGGPAEVGSPGYHADY